VRDAFHVARRVLEDYVRKTRGDVKTHHDSSPDRELPAMPR
jgi:hypothetical protein